jgi:RNA polymerase sigma-70 factor (ECF subfamily)
MQANQAEPAHIALLVARAKQGDREAFDDLVELYTPQVYSVALRITGSREEAEDCVQEAFLRAFSALRGFRGEAAFSTWLYRVAVNAANDAARRRSRQPLSASDLSDSGSDDAPPDLDRVGRHHAPPANQPEEAVLQQQRRRIVLRAIRSLPEKHRSVILLYDLQGLSYEQIARITKTRVGTVKSRLSRARLALKDLLAPHMELLRE